MEMKADSLFTRRKFTRQRGLLEWELSHSRESPSPVEPVHNTCRYGSLSDSCLIWR